MDISVLEIFVEVMRQGNFAGVARERNIDPSSVSRIIAGLESEIGVRLFQRSTRKLAPTEEIFEKSNKSSLNASISSTFNTRIRSIMNELS